jgi:hypothetical protein
VPCCLGGGRPDCISPSLFIKRCGLRHVTVPANGFAMIAIQLDSGNNTLGSLIPTAPDGAEFFKYNNGAYTSAVWDALNDSWDTPITLNPGEGGFFRNNTASPLAITFVGEVMQGSLTNHLPAGYAIRSSIVPQQGTLQDLGIPLTGPGAPSDGDQVFLYNGSYSASTYDGLGNAWDTPGSPGGPTINVGQAFFIKSSVAYDWTRNFTVQ